MRNLTDVALKARALMNHHGLSGWAFGFNSRKRAAGVCKFGPKTIELSTAFAQNASDDDILDTILHEIAHAIAGNKAGHGPEWKMVCRRIGANPSRVYEDTDNVMPKGAWIGRCSNGHEIDQHRAPLRVKSCSRCSRVFKPEAILVWHKNGRRMPIGEMPVRYARELVTMRLRYNGRLPVGA